MKNFLASSAVRLAGLLLLAAAVNLASPREALATPPKCVERPFLACLECTNVPSNDGQTCRVLICVAGPTIIVCEE